MSSEKTFKVNVAIKLHLQNKVLQPIWLNYIHRLRYPYTIEVARPGIWASRVLRKLRHSAMNMAHKIRSKNRRSGLKLKPAARRARRCGVAVVALEVVATHAVPGLEVTDGGSALHLAADGLGARRTWPEIQTLNRFG
jgi:hypothetical protein